MRVIKRISEDEMVAVFLEAEIDSPRFRDNILKLLQTKNLDRQIIDRPDLNDSFENAGREEVLSEFRGYKRDAGVFKGFPKKVAWYRVELTRTDLEKVKYIDYPYWVNISGDTRLALDGARRVKSTEVDKEIAAWISDVAGNLKLEEDYAEIILVSNSWDPRDLVVLEGHLGITCYLLKREYLPSEIRAVLGYSNQMKK